MPGTRKLGKTTDQRMAMLRQQVTDFLDNGRMETTVTRAKEIKPLAEKMITLGKKGDLAAYRQALSFITRETVAHKLFKEIAPEYAERQRKNTGRDLPLHRGRGHRAAARPLPEHSGCGADGDRAFTAAGLRIRNGGGVAGDQGHRAAGREDVPSGRIEKRPGAMLRGALCSCVTQRRPAYS